ncbi:hypothetical protein H2203_003935 [Taxawa tesnikishii (nom. ined.)]|nr:hypothetical protein H2203_003935 [Dothideales sp. JES 119]
MAINQAGGNRKKSMRANKSSGVVTETLDKILSSLESLTNRMGEVEELMKDSRPLAGSLAQSQPSLRVKRDESSVPDSVTVTQHATPDIKYTPNGTINNQQAGLAVANNNQDQGSEEPPQDEPANFSDHTTAAHKLLYLWPSIRPLISNHEPPRDYVMQLEDRGLLRLWGRGEGEEREETMALGAASPAPSDKSEDAPTPPDGTWGNSNPSYSNTSGEARRSVPVSAGGLGMDGRSNLNADVIDRLYRSYNKHIYRLHPFLDYSALDKIIATFIKRYSPDGSAATPSFITNGIGDGTYGRPPKRAKTSQGAITSSSSESSVHTANVKPIERSITSAIVLLVLALGAVCEHIEQLRDRYRTTSPIDLADR